MKASTLISTVLASAVAVRGAAMEARQEETSASAESVPPIQSASTIISGSASASFSVPPIATTTPGAFASLGLYTTCLEFTFTQAPVPSVTATPLSCGADSTSGTGVDTSVIPILSPTATASASVGTSVAVSGSVSASAPASSVSIMSTPLAVFSTCLLFFPSDTVTPTQSVSVTSLPSASASVSFSFTSSAVATSAASLV